MELKPGWLWEDMQAAGDSLRAQHGPQWHEANNLRVEIPITAAEADRLYRTLAARFKAWTGKDISSYQPL